VKTMDAVQAFLPTIPDMPTIDSFFVAGGSKRGWTSWTTAAVDSRIIGVVPVVMPILNMIDNMNHQWRAYGNWSFALDDYLDEHVMYYLNRPQMFYLASIVDPYSYVNRLTMPKYVVIAAGDEFFLPDSPQFFLSDMLGPTYLRIVPNAEHSLIGHVVDVSMAAETFYHRVINNKPLPQYSWTLGKSNTSTANITLTVKDKPTHVYMWWAITMSEVRRDFRLLICGNLNNPDCLQPVVWYWTELTDNGNGVYVAQQDPPEHGWIGFFIELDYVYSDLPFAPETSLKFTTEINVVPDRLPFPPCGKNCQPY